MPKLDLTRATRIKGAGGEIASLKGPGFSWTKPESDLPVTSGLVLHHETKDPATYTLNGSEVTLWNDQSGQGNHVWADAVEGGATIQAAATPTGQPSFGTLAGNGHLVRVHTTAPISGLPAGNADRTMIWIWKWIEGTWSGWGYGTPSTRQACVLGGNSSTPPRLAVMGYGDDDVAPAGNTATGWIVQSMVMASGDFTHYRNGVEIDSGTQSNDWNTDPQKIVYLREIGDLRTMLGEYAGAVIYNRALSSTERANVEQYFIDTYGITV